MSLSDKILTYAIVGTVAYVLIAKPKVSVLGLPIFSVSSQNEQVFSPPSTSSLNNPTPSQSIFYSTILAPFKGLDMVARSIAGWLV